MSSILKNMIQLTKLDLGIYDVTLNNELILELDWSF